MTYHDKNPSNAISERIHLCDRLLYDIDYFHLKKLPIYQILHIPHFNVVLPPKVGLVGSSDHSRWPGGRGGPWVYPYALTGLWAENASREAIFDALMKRRCYATNGKKIIVIFSSDERFMGEEYETDEPPVLEVHAAGDAIVLHSIELIRNGEVIFSSDAGSLTMRIRYRDEEVEPGHYYYYARVIQEREGEDNYRGVAITSPIWITIK